MESALNNDVAFVSGTEDEIRKYSLFEEMIMEIDVVYDMQFVDMEGNIYQINEKDMEFYASCNHSYRAGFFDEHIKHTNGELYGGTI